MTHTCMQHMDATKHETMRESLHTKILEFFLKGTLLGNIKFTDTDLRENTPNDLLMNIIPGEISNFYLVNKDIEAQRGKRKLPEIAAGGDRSVGARILPRVGGVDPAWPLLGSSPGVPATERLLNPQTL